MARIVLTRKTSGGRTCFFMGKGGRMTTTRGRGGTRPPKGVKETMNETSTPNSKASIVMMDKKQTPSNHQVSQTKSNHDNLINKLSSLKLTKPKNISFQV